MAKTNIIHKPNELIQVLPASEQRISGTMRLLYNGIILLSQQLGKQEEYIVVLNDLLSLCNLTSDFRTIKKMFKDIRRIDFEWRYIDNDVDDTHIIGLIDEPRFITRKGKQTIVTWKLNTLIQDRLIDPDAFFTRINLEMMTKLTKSGASLALYEICARYLTNNKAGGDGRTGKHDVDWWRPRLVGSLEYTPEYKFLKRDFIKPAIEEINRLTDIHVEIIEHKRGRTISEIEFTISKNINSIDSSNLSALPDDGLVDASRVKKAISLGVNPKSAATILANYQNSEYIDQHLKGLEDALKKGDIKSPAAWLRGALNENWSHTPAKVKKVNQSTRPLKKKSITQDETLEIAKRSTEEKELAYSKYLLLSDDMQKQKVDMYLADETNDFVKGEYSKKKFKSPIFIIHFKIWLSGQGVT